jgi:PAS domain S-box-containing protein
MSLKKIIFPPVFPGNEEKTQTAYFLYIILLTCIVLLSVLLTVRSMMPSNYRIMPFIILTGLIILFLVLLILVHRGYVQTASLIFVIIGWSGMTTEAIFADGVRNVTVVANIIVILMATLLLGRRTAIVFTLLSIISIWVMVFLETNNIIHPLSDKLPNLARDLTTIFILVALLIFLYSKSQQISIDRIKNELLERKEAENKLRESENAYRTLFEKNPVGVATIKLSGEFIDANEKFCQLTGISCDQAIRQNAFQLKLFDFMNDSIIKQKFSRLNGTLENYENVIKNNAGHFQLFEISANTLMLQHEPVIIMMLHDITQRRKAEEALRLSEQKFTESFHVSPLVIVISDSMTGKFVDVNEAFVKLSGWKYAASIGKSGMDLGLWVNMDQREFVLKQIQHSKIIKGFECDFRTKTGNVLTMQYSAAYINYSNGKYVVSTLLDITESKKAKEALIENEKHLREQNEEYSILNEKLKIAIGKAEESDRLKTSFLQNMSHEIRSPMNAIIGFSELLNSSGITKKEISVYTDVMINSSKQLLSVVTDILTISSIETGQETVNETPVNVNSLLFDLKIVYKLQLKNKKLAIKIIPALPDEMAIMMTDETKLTQILSNLINNAIKFTQTGNIEVGYTLDTSMMRFYVKDTGIGIDLRFHKKIFERFKQADDSINRKYGGTGLGLAISKALTEILGGKIMVDSKPGEGSVFSFSIPYKPLHDNPVEKKNRIQKTKPFKGNSIEYTG